MTRYIDQLNECTDPTTGDYLLLYDASAGATDKDRKVNISRFAILANAQSFTTTQTIAPATTGANGFIVNMPTSNTAYALNIQYNGTRRVDCYTQLGSSVFEIIAADFGSAQGPMLSIERNSNVTTPAAATLQLMPRTGTACYYWTDNAGIFRVSTSAAPTSSTDTSGTVVGTQTSSLDSKNINEALPNPRESFAFILEAALKGLRSWSYKSGAFNNELFPNGLVTDLAPRYGMDRDAAHPHGKSLNIPVAIGDLIASISILHERITALEGA